MVWHAFMLNPRNYLADCLRLECVPVWAMGLPWAALMKCIDNETFEYEPGASAHTAFEEMTGHRWDGREDDKTREVRCPRCTAVNTAPLTTVNAPHMWKGEFDGEGEGLADRWFKSRCLACWQNLSHEVLRCDKFLNDLQDLLQNRKPMPGTLLNENGKLPPRKSWLRR